MMQIQEFIDLNGIKITSENVSENPCNPEWRNANHYKCVLRRKTDDGKTKKLTIYFSKGYGLKGAPMATEVLYSMGMDSHSIDDQPDFYKWCDDFGYTRDKKAKVIFKAVLKNRNKLVNFLGDDLYAALLECDML